MSGLNGAASWSYYSFFHPFILQDAQVSIPKGTLLAILISTIVYLIMAWSCGMCAVRNASGALVAAVGNASMVGDLVTPAIPVVLTNTTDDVTDLYNADVTLDICTQAGNCTYGLLNNPQVRLHVIRVGLHAGASV